MLESDLSEFVKNFLIKTFQKLVSQNEASFQEFFNRKILKLLMVFGKRTFSSTVLLLCFRLLFYYSFCLPCVNAIHSIFLCSCSLVIFVVLLLTLLGFLPLGFWSYGLGSSYKCLRNMYIRYCGTYRLYGYLVV